MKANSKRIFIKYLPETIQESDIEKSFSKYGKVVKIEVKERKDSFQQVESKLFAYINIEIDDKSLNRCFKDFADNSWHGKYVQLDLAKQSFLDILKQEREQSGTKNNNEFNATTQNGSEDVREKPKTLKTKKEKSKILIKTSDNEAIQNGTEEYKTIKTEKFETPIKLSDTDNDKKQVKPSENVVNGTTNKKRKATTKLSDKNDEKQAKSSETLVKNKSEILRSKSVNQMIKNYQKQKLAIKSALSKVDLQSNKKIIFDDLNNETVNNTSLENGHRKSLFESDDDEGPEEAFSIAENSNFAIQDPKLFELQAKYKNDKRFKLDERFVDNEEESTTNKDSSEISLELEKKKELDILSQVLGGVVKPKHSNSQEKIVAQKGMLRFDPTQEDHLKYEVKQPSDKKSKAKRKQNEEAVEISKPTVSQEVFYKVDDGLKNALEGPEDFSLINLFGQKKEDKVDENEQNEAVVIDQKNNTFSEKNPFKYDSSDEDEQEMEIEQPEVEETGANFWSDPFFFRDDDFRLQEGSDFVQRLGSEKSEFQEQRGNVKQLIKGKLKNIKQKNNPFRKKLGGGKKRKKNVRIKKAMKK